MYKKTNGVFGKILYLPANNLKGIKNSIVFYERNWPENKMIYSIKQFKAKQK